MRDDMWAVTSAELNAVQSLQREMVDKLKNLYVIFDTDLTPIASKRIEDLIARAEKTL